MGGIFGLMGNFGEVIDRVYTAKGVVTPTSTPAPTSTPTRHVTGTPTQTPDANAFGYPYFQNRRINLSSEYFSSRFAWLRQKYG